MTGIHQLLFSSFAATGGGVDTSVHTFNSDDTLAIGAATKLNWLLVAGGGGGAGGVSGSDNGGGGGAGGFRRGQNTPITGDLHIDVGGGGAGGPAGSSGTVGENSRLSYATGGGGQGEYGDSGKWADIDSFGE